MREIQLEQRFERDMEIARAEVDADTQWRDHSIDQSVKSDCLKPENMESWLSLPEACCRSPSSSSTPLSPAGSSDPDGHPSQLFVTLGKTSVTNRSAYHTVGKASAYLAIRGRSRGGG